MKQIIFGGSASQNLAKKIAERNNLELGKREVVTFANSEIKVTIQSVVENRQVIVVQSTSNPTNNNLIELLFMIDALKRQGAEHLTVIIPYFGYARQNMQHREGECVSLNVVVKMLESLEVDKVETVELHDEGSSSVFSIGFQNKSALPLLAKETFVHLSVTPETETQYVIGSPDQGGIERARLFADHFYQEHQNQETIVVEKKRNLDGLHDSKAVEVFGDVEGKKIILVDDVSTSGKTIVHAAEMLLAKGAKEVSAVVVHPDFAINVPLYIQESPLGHFFTTNTIEKTLEPLSKYSKITQVNISPLFEF